MKTVIMGTGGLGGYFGARLAQAGMDVTFIARGETLSVIRENGLRVFSPHGDFSIDSINATDNTNNVSNVDLILLCVKSYDLESAIEAIQPMLNHNTTLIPVQNGVSHIPRLQTALGRENVLGGLTMINAHKGEPGIFHHVTDGGQYQIEFGEWAQPVSQRCEQIQQMWEQAGVSAIAVPDIEERMWRKLALFCSVGVFAVARGDKGKVWIPEIQAIAHKILAEVVAVAQAQQIPLPDSLPDDVLQLASSENVPSTYKPSLLVDLEHGRRLEVAVTNGFISDLGKELNVATPANDFVYACLKPHINGTH